MKIQSLTDKKLPVVIFKKLPVDFDTWQKMEYDPNYYVPNSPFGQVAQSALQFYKNRLEELDDTLTEENKAIFKESMEKIENLLNSK